MLELVKVAAPLLAIVSFVLICLGFTKLGKMKVFRFTLGEIALVTAIAYAFQTALAVSAFAPFGIAIWFAISSMNFAQATWLATE
ncbi:MAG: hypothetical protein AAB897_03155 [Patescibacteria group bacterium]|mgnify:FL=1